LAVLDRLSVAVQNHHAGIFPVPEWPLRDQLARQRIVVIVHAIAHSTAASGNSAKRAKL
jgi:hypothetical protein